MNKYKYRFKTLNELEEEYGSTWTTDTYSGWVRHRMDYLLGNDIDIEFYKQRLETNGRLDLSKEFIIIVDGFMISNRTIKEKQLIPTYNEQKILVYE